MRIFLSVLAIIMALPIGLYIQYQILQSIQASELVMFLWWFNIPLVLLIQIGIRLTDKSLDKTTTAEIIAELAKRK